MRGWLQDAALSAARWLHDHGWHDLSIALCDLERFISGLPNSAPGGLPHLRPAPEPTGVGLPCARRRSSPAGVGPLAVVAVAFAVIALALVVLT